MTPEAAAAIAAALVHLAEAVQQAAQEQPQTQRRKLRLVAAEMGMPASTLRELCLRREITAARVGRSWMVNPADVEAYMQRHEIKARGSRPRLVAPAH